MLFLLVSTAAASREHRYEVIDQDLMAEEEAYRQAYNQWVLDQYELSKPKPMPFVVKLLVVAVLSWAFFKWKGL